MILSIDPGTKEIGWAVWVSKRLVECGLTRGKHWTETVNNLPEFALRPDELFIEDQQIYTYSKADPNRLLTLAHVTGAIIHHYRAPNTHLVLPRVWKRQVPKKISNERIIRRLEPGEKAVLENMNCPNSLRHNVVDAIGIGLWGLDRNHGV